jgi:hypothetical protein
MRIARLILLALPAALACASTTFADTIALRPSARVLTITVIDASSRRLRDEDRLAADIVIYGFAVERKKAEGEGEGEGEGEAEGAGQPAQPAPPSQPAQAAEPTQSADPAQPSGPESASPPANPAQTAPANTETPAIPSTQPSANCR